MILLIWLVSCSRFIHMHWGFAIGLLSKNPVSNNWIHNFCMVDHYNPQNTCVSILCSSEWLAKHPCLASVIYIIMASSPVVDAGLVAIKVRLHGKSVQCTCDWCIIILSSLYLSLWWSDHITWCCSPREVHVLTPNANRWSFVDTRKSFPKYHHLISFYLLCINTETNCSQ